MLFRSVNNSREYFYVGDIIDVLVRVKSSVYLGAWKYSLDYDKLKLELVNGEEAVVGYGNGIDKIREHNIQFRVLDRGNVQINLSDAEMVSWDEMKIFKPKVNNLDLKLIKFVLGDITFDGKVDLHDVMLALRINLEIVNDASEDVIRLGDLNGVGGIDLSDVISILRLSLNSKNL